MKCKNCGRTIKSKKSQEIGYGPTCWKKVQLDNRLPNENQNEKETIHQIEGQINFIDELRGIAI